VFRATASSETIDLEALERLFELIDVVCYECINATFGGRVNLHGACPLNLIAIGEEKMLAKGSNRNGGNREGTFVYTKFSAG
jgi:hypothetical protein